MRRTKPPTHLQHIHTTYPRLPSSHIRLPQTSFIPTNPIHRKENPSQNISSALPPSQRPSISRHRNHPHHGPTRHTPTKLHHTNTKRHKQSNSHRNTTNFSQTTQPPPSSRQPNSQKTPIQTKTPTSRSPNIPLSKPPRPPPRPRGGYSPQHEITGTAPYLNLQKTTKER